MKPEPGKTKISIRLDNTVIEFFRAACRRLGQPTETSQRRQGPGAPMLLDTLMKQKE